MVPSLNISNKTPYDKDSEAHTKDVLIPCIVFGDLDNVISNKEIKIEQLQNEINTNDIEKITLL